MLELWDLRHFSDKCLLKKRNNDNKNNNNQRFHKNNKGTMRKIKILFKQYFFK